MGRKNKRNKPKVLPRTEIERTGPAPSAMCSCNSAGVTAAASHRVAVYSLICAIASAVAAIASVGVVVWQNRLIGEQAAMSQRQFDPVFEIGAIADVGEGQVWLLEGQREFVKFPYSGGKTPSLVIPVTNKGAEASVASTTLRISYLTDTSDLSGTIGPGSVCFLVSGSNAEGQGWSDVEWSFGWRKGKKEPVECRFDILPRYFVEKTSLPLRLPPNASVAGIFTLGMPRRVIAGQPDIAAIGREISRNSLSHVRQNWKLLRVQVIVVLTSGREVVFSGDITRDGELLGDKVLAGAVWKWIKQSNLLDE